MRKPLGIILLLGSLFVPSAYAEQSAAPSGTDVTSKCEEQIEALENKLAALIVSGNWTEYEKRLTLDFTYIDGNAKLETREELLTGYKSGPRKVIVMEPEDLRVRTYGDTAILQGERTTSAREGGRVSSIKVRFTEVFVERKGDWYLAAEQETMEKRR